MMTRRHNISSEQQTVRFMIEYYCRKKHQKGALCPDCTNLVEYSEKRLAGCRFGTLKPSCRKCTSHCYRSDYREAIRAVMRYTGPRMVYLKPLSLIEHLLRR